MEKSFKGITRNDFTTAFMPDQNTITIMYLETYDHDEFTSTQFEDSIDVEATPENFKAIKEVFGYDTYDVTVHYKMTVLPTSLGEQPSPTTASFTTTVVADHLETAVEEAYWKAEKMGRIVVKIDEPIKRT